MPATEEFFYKSKLGKYGLRSDCKKCNTSYSKQYGKQHYQENKEKIKQYQRKNEEKIKSQRQSISRKKYEKYWYQKNKDRRKVLYKNNAEKISQKRLQYRKENSETIKQRNKQYWHNNLEKARVHRQKRESLKKGLLASYTTQQWDRCKKSFNNKCAYCGKEELLQQDHFIPLSKDGEYTVNNIIPACKSCNTSKGNKDFFEWYPKQLFYSKQRRTKILKYLNYSDQIQQLSIST